MTTTAATTSASASTPNDSPMHDLSGASEQSNDRQQSEPSPTQPPSQQLSSPPPPSQPEVQQQPQQPQQQQSSKIQTTNNSNANPNEQKRPMNAFLLFCKKQRSLVREKYPNLENRGITKILGDWWSKLDKEQKSKYTDLARQHKEAFMKANPDFKWCKTPMSHNNNNTAGSSANQTSNGINNSNDCYSNNINSRNVDVHMDSVQSNGRESMIGAAREPSSINHHHQPHHNHQSYIKNDQHSIDQQNKHQHQLHHQHHQQPGAPKPPKKRFLESTKNDSTNNDSGTLKNLGEVVPIFTLIHPPDALDRVIDEAFSETTNNSSPSGKNMCKSFNRDLNSSNLTSTIGSSPILYAPTTTTQAALMSTSVVASARPTELAQLSPANQQQAAPSYSPSNDEPVDFSMNRTINATRQQIIGKSVERYLMSPSDNASNTFKKVK